MPNLRLLVPSPTATPFPFGLTSVARHVDPSDPHWRNGVEFEAECFPPALTDLADCLEVLPSDPGDDGSGGLDPELYAATVVLGGVHIAPTEDLPDGFATWFLDVTYPDECRDMAVSYQKWVGDDLTLPDPADLPGMMDNPTVVDPMPDSVGGNPRITGTPGQAGASMLIVAVFTIPGTSWSTTIGLFCMDMYDQGVGHNFQASVNGGPWATLAADPGDGTETYAATSTDWELAEVEPGPAPVPSVVDKFAEYLSGGWGATSSLPFTLFATHRCASVGRSSAEDRTRAERALIAGEGRGVESVALTGATSAGNMVDSIVADAVIDTYTNPAGSSVEVALASLEAAVLRATGAYGVIHMPASIAALLASRRVLEVRSGSLYTRLGTPVAAYSWWEWGARPADAVEDGSVLYMFATGPVLLYRGGVTVLEDMDRSVNTRYVVAERDYALAWSKCSVFYAPVLVASLEGDAPSPDQA